jgi:hypothetical protein
MGRLVKLQSGAFRFYPTNPYCSLTDVLEEIRESESAAAEGSQKANELLRSIERASRFVDRWMGRDYVMHDLTVTPYEIDEESQGYTKDYIFLPYSPLIDPASLIVSIGGSALTKDTDYQVITGSYGDLSTDIRLKCLNALATFADGGRGPWGISRADGKVMQVYGLFGYDQRIITDDDGNESYGSTGTYSAENIPAVPDLIRHATRQVAAAMSGHLRREFTDLNGTRQSVTNRDIDKLAMEILGTKQGLIRT